MKEKRKLILDFDSTVVESIKAYCDVYNNWFADRKGFVKANYTKVMKWDFDDECALAINNVMDIFSSEDFFKVLEPMDDDTIKIIHELQKHFDVSICTIGTPGNISRKAIWIEENLGIEDMILLSQGNVKMDKSIVNMEGAIFVDDHMNNLVSSNADIKIAFGNTKPWNKDWKGFSVNCWQGLYNLLMYIK